MGTGLSGNSLWLDSLKAHLLFFERPLAPAYPASRGLRMLVAFFVVAVALFFALRHGLAGIRLGEGAFRPSLFVAGLFAAFLVLQRAWLHLPFAHVGLRPWRDWTRRERLYLFQVVPLAALVFALVFRTHLQALWQSHGTAGFVVFSLATGLAWGAIQELLYRGWLQTELTRRFGAWAGLLLANLAFTFGPLHLDYLTDPQGPRWLGLLAVFGIGLLFGTLYRRSGNLWLPALLHGLWPPNMG